MIQKILIGFLGLVVVLFLWGQAEKFWKATVAKPKDTDPTVAETLKAPFAEDAIKEEAEEAKEAKEEETAGLPENQIAMDQPHRAAFQIREWVITVISDAMSFHTEDYKETLSQNEGHFSPTGRQQYITFLEDSGLQRFLSSENHVVRTVVQEDPFLINEGAVEGRYRWLYEVPVMVTILEGSRLDYKEIQPVNKNMVIKIQVGRSRTTSDPAGLRVERWSWSMAK